jgi:hydroxyacylglutathione hydrolase
MLNAQSETFVFPMNNYTITCLVNGGNWKQNSFIVSRNQSGAMAVIDPGDHADLIIRSVAEKGGVLKHILLTHAHFDHVGAVTELSRHFGLPCRLHKKDVRLLMHAPMYAMRFANKTIPAVSSFEVFEEFESAGDDLGAKAIHTPGHTPGSTCYLFDGFVFAGDTILFEHIGRTDLPGGDSTLIGQSIDRLLTTLDEDTVIFPGHGKQWKVREARLWWDNIKGAPPSFDGSNVATDYNGD